MLSWAGIKMYIYIAAGIFALGLGYEVKRIWDQSNLYEAAKADLATCNATTVKTKELNDGLQKSRDTISAKLDELKRVHPSSCVRINAVGTGTGPTGPDGAVTGTSDQFREFAAKCSVYRSERIALEQLLEDEKN